jgi:hypothetical protein
LKNSDGNMGDACLTLTPIGRKSKRRESVARSLPARCHGKAILPRPQVGGRADRPDRVTWHSPGQSLVCLSRATGNLTFQHTGVRLAASEGQGDETSVMELSKRPARDADTATAAATFRSVNLSSRHSFRVRGWFSGIAGRCAGNRFLTSPLFNIENDPPTRTGARLTQATYLADT